MIFIWIGNIRMKLNDMLMIIANFAPKPDIMKKFLLLTVMLIATVSVSAQSLETKSEFTTGYMKIEPQMGEHLESIDGVLFMTNGYNSTLLRFPPNSSVTEYAIPESVNRIASGAFRGCKNLKKLVFPSSWNSNRIAITIATNAFDDSGIESFEVGTTSSVSQKSASTAKLSAKHYNIAGQQLNDSAKGINIMKYSDGTTKKYIQ